jgi:hypothetical protein
MTSHDQERIHRWLTQAELDALVNAARAEGFYNGSDAMRRHAATIARTSKSAEHAADGIAQCDHPEYRE